MKRGADVEPQFLARKFGDVVDQRSARRLQIAPGVLRQMDDTVGFVDDDARRREALQRLAMNARPRSARETAPAFAAATARVRKQVAGPRRDAHLGDDIR